MKGISGPIVAAAIPFLAVATPTTQPTAVGVRVDPRIELLTVVQSLGSSTASLGLLNALESPYHRDVAEYFAGYSGHPAVACIDELAASGFNFDAPYQLMVELSNPPTLNPLAGRLTDDVIERAGGVAPLEDCLVHMRDFATRTRFISFFNAHRGSFDRAVEPLRQTMDEADYVGALEAYYGERQSSYTVILAPLASGNFGPRVAGSDGLFHVYSILGAQRFRDGYPEFVERGDLVRLLWHEFGHSFVNPLTARYADALQRSSSLYEPIAQRMGNQSYGSWETAVNEHLVRAVTARLTALHLEPEMGAITILRERSRGFAYIESIARELRAFETDRNRFPAFELFLPRVMQVLDSLARADLPLEFFAAPFIGPINAVASDSTTLMVLPTAESDMAAQTAIRDYVIGIRERFMPRAGLVTDVEAQSMDLSAFNLLIYGTPNGNLLAREIVALMPVRITPSEIRTAQSHVGTGLRFITAWPNPHDPSHAVVLYAAQRAEDVVGIHGVFHGPTDFVVARGTTVIEAGNYQAKHRAWSFRPRP